MFSKNGSEYCKDNYPLLSKDNWWKNNKIGFSKRYARPTQSLLQRWIREKRGVHIEIERNASGYYWGMCRSDGGTNLGWSDMKGPNDGAVWDSFEEALEAALQLQLSYDLPKTLKKIGHWSNYVDYAYLNK